MIMTWRFEGLGAIAAAVGAYTLGIEISICFTEWFASLLQLLTAIEMSKYYHLARSNKVQIVPFKYFASGHVQLAAGPSDMCLVLVLIDRFVSLFLSRRVGFYTISCLSLFINTVLY